MAEDTKIVHIAVVDGEPQQIRALANRLSEIRDKLPFDAEFLITNDKVQFRDVKWLLQELVSLVKRAKK